MKNSPQQKNQPETGSNTTPQKPPLPVSDPHSITKTVFTWYKQNQRKLPWRETRNPYYIWISEAMLQQTQVETVIPYYKRFIARFPTIQSLAEAELDAVMKLWENLGYYARARNLHRAAQTVQSRFNGRVPETYEELVALPGVGPYMAGAISSIAFNRPCPAIDGNVRRIISRLYCLQSPLDESATRNRADGLAAELVPAEHPGEFNQALMDIGATICRPKAPECQVCPVASFCLGYHQGLQNTLPIRTPKPAIPVYDAVVLLAPELAGRLLLTKNANSGLLGGLWAFPGKRFDRTGVPADHLETFGSGGPAPCKRR